MLDPINMNPAPKLSPFERALGYLFLWLILVPIMIGMRVWAIR